MIGLAPGQPSTRILIVDDTDENRLLLTQLLGSAGFSVQEASNGLQALERWEASGTQVSVERAVLLRLGTPEILAALKKTRAARFIEEELTATTVLLRPGSEEKVLDALGEIGYLGDIREI